MPATCNYAEQRAEFAVGAVSVPARIDVTRSGRAKHAAALLVVPGLPGALGGCHEREARDRDRARLDDGVAGRRRRVGELWRVVCVGRGLVKCLRQGGGQAEK